MFFFFSSRRRHTRFALVTGVQTCALPICHSYPGNPFQQIAKRLRRAARNGTAFHLPPELVPALLASDAMPIILDLETREIRAGLKIGRASCRERVCQYV